MARPEHVRSRHETWCGHRGVVALVTLVLLLVAAGCGGKAASSRAHDSRAAQQEQPAAAEASPRDAPSDPQAYSAAAAAPSDIAVCRLMETSPDRWFHHAFQAARTPAAVGAHANVCRADTSDGWYVSVAVDPRRYDPQQWGSSGFRATRDQQTVGGPWDGGVLQPAAGGQRLVVLLGHLSFAFEYGAPSRATVPRQALVEYAAQVLLSHFKDRVDND